ncbi:MAG: hypothetical protein U1F22_03530 [Lysobacterales bacterium]
MNISETQRPPRAVLVTITREDGGLRLSLDDVERQAPDAWVQREHYTSKLIEEKSLDEMSFDEKELADFGHHILARLYAFKSGNEI